MNGTRDVFQLRREGRLQEALQLARQLYAENPNDPWCVKALAWSLYSAWKAREQPQETGLLAEELLALTVPSDDEMLQRSLQAVRRAQDPAHPDIARAKELSQAGNHEQAAAVLEQCLRRYPGNAAAENALSWDIWRQLNGLLRDENPPAQQITNLIRRYAKCGAVERPSVIHSRMLEVVARAARAGAFPKFCGFLHWWDPETNIRVEDLTGQTNEEGYEFPGVAQHAIFAIGKTIEDETGEDAVQTALGFMQTYAPQYAGEEWFPYFLGLGLCRAGRLDEALRHLVPFARAKSSEFWIWQKLAVCFAPDDARHLACLCRSALCGSKGPEFLLGVRQQLASALRAAGHDDEARHEVEAVVALRQQRGWKVPDELAVLQGQDWFQAATAREGKALFRRLAAQADEILVRDVPWVRALLQARDVPGERGPSAIVLVELQGGQETVRLRMNAFDELKRLQAGETLTVRITTEGEHKRIFALQRREGQPWDLLPELCGIVVRVNQQKGVTSLMLANGETSLAHHDGLPEAAGLRAGDFVFVRSAPGRGVGSARTFRRCDEPPASQHWRPFEGGFRSREKGGGHVGDVFVEAHLASGLEAGCQVRGVAVKQKSDNGSSWWSAVLATATEEAPGELDVGEL